MSLKSDVDRCAEKASEDDELYMGYMRTDCMSVCLGLPNVLDFQRKMP